MTYMVYDGEKLVGCFSEIYAAEGMKKRNPRLTIVGEPTPELEDWDMDELEEEMKRNFYANKKEEK